jgi:hypothetical protein
MSACGTARQFAAMRNFGRDRSKADKGRASRLYLIEMGHSLQSAALRC